MTAYGKHQYSHSVSTSSRIEMVKAAYFLPPVKPVIYSTVRNTFSTSSAKGKQKIVIQQASVKQIANVPKKPTATLTTLREENKSSQKVIASSQSIVKQKTVVGQAKKVVCSVKSDLCKTTRKSSINELHSSRTDKKLLPKGKTKAIQKCPGSYATIDVSPLKVKRGLSAQGHRKFESCKVESTYKEQKECSLSEFQLLDTIGVGCFGRVKLAKWLTNTDKPCAIKIVAKEYAVKLKQIDHLAYEKDLLLSLNNPFIVKW